MFTKIRESDAANKFQIAFFVIEIARFIMGIWDWIESKRASKAQTLESDELFSIHCSGCLMPTRTFVSGEYMLVMPPTYCEKCVVLDEKDIAQLGEVFTNE